MHQARHNQDLDCGATYGFTTPGSRRCQTCRAEARRYIEVLPRRINPSLCPAESGLFFGREEAREDCGGLLPLMRFPLELFAAGAR
jgi:hypothetical protein